MGDNPPEPVREGRFEELSLRHPQTPPLANESGRKRFLAKLVLIRPIELVQPRPFHCQASVTWMRHQSVGATTRLPQAGRTGVISPKYWRVIRLLPMSVYHRRHRAVYTRHARAQLRFKASSAASVAGLLSRLRIRREPLMAQTTSILDDLSQREWLRLPHCQGCPNQTQSAIGES